MNYSSFAVTLVLLSSQCCALDRSERIEPWAVSLTEHWSSFQAKSRNPGFLKVSSSTADPTAYDVISEDPEFMFRRQEAQDYQQQLAQIQAVERRAWVELEQGRLENARRLLEQSISMGGTASGAEDLAEIMIRQGDVNQVYHVVVPWITHPDASTRLLLFASLATAQRQVIYSGQHRFVLKFLSTSWVPWTDYQSMLPTSQQPWAVAYLSALALANSTSDNDGAVAFYQLAADLWAADALAHEGLATTYVREGQTQKARQALRVVARFAKGTVRENALIQLRTLP